MSGVKEIERPPRNSLVDDEPDITSSLRIGLERHGFQADGFNDPKKAMGEFKPNRYDMIFLDARMLQMNGFELYRGLRASDREAPIAFLDRVRCLPRRVPDDVFRHEGRRAAAKPTGINEPVTYEVQSRQPKKSHPRPTRVANRVPAREAALAPGASPRWLPAGQRAGELRIRFLSLHLGQILLVFVEDCP